MDKAGLEGRVALDPLQGDFAAQPVKIGQAVIGQIGIVRGGLNVECQFEIVAQVKPALGKQVSPVLIRLHVIAGKGTFELNAAISERLPVAIPKRRRLGRQIGGQRQVLVIAQLEEIRNLHTRSKLRRRADGRH